MDSKTNMGDSKQCYRANSLNKATEDKRISKCLKSNLVQKSQPCPVPTNKNTKTISFQTPSSSCRRKESVKAAEPDSTSELFSVCKQNSESHNSERGSQKTWYDLLKEENTNSAFCNCDKNSFHCPKYSSNHTEGSEVSNNLTEQPIHFLNRLVNRLYDKVCERSDEEISFLVFNIKRILTSMPMTNQHSKPINQGNSNVLIARNEKHSFNKENNRKPSTCACSNINPGTELRQNRSSPVTVDKVSKAKAIEKDSRNAHFISETKTPPTTISVKHGVDVAHLNEVNKNLESVNLKTDECGKNIQVLQKLLLNLHNENKMINEMKEIKCGLEAKLEVLSCENKYLKKELQLLHTERKRDNIELENKSKEISNLKEQILKIKNMLLSSKTNKKSNRMSAQDSSSRCNRIKRIPRPVSSSPVDTSIYELDEEQQIRMVHRNGNEKVKDQIESGKSDNDSGIQSNTPGNNKTSVIPTLTSKKDESSGISDTNCFDSILADLKTSLNINDDDLQPYLPSNFCDTDASMCLSETTYKYNLSNFTNAD